MRTKIASAHTVLKPTHTVTYFHCYGPAEISISEPRKSLTARLTLALFFFFYAEGTLTVMRPFFCFTTLMLL